MSANCPEECSGNQLLRQLKVNASIGAVVARVTGCTMASCGGPLESSSVDGR